MGTGAALRFSSTGNRKLLLYSDQLNVKQGYWIETDADNPSQNGNYLSETFTGEILTYDLNNKFISGEKYKSGKLKALIRLSDSDQANKIPLLNFLSTSNILRVKTSASSLLGTSALSDEPIRNYRIMGGGLLCTDFYVRVCIPAIDYCGEWRYDSQSCTYIPDAGAGPGIFNPPSSGGSTGGGGGGSTGGGGGAAISQDPYTEGGSVGYGPDPYSQDILDVIPPPSDWLVCPTNFSFVSVTTHDLWQESVVTGIYCNLAIIGTTQQGFIRVEIPEMHFGLPYNNVEGELVYTKQQAAEIAADAFNLGEYKMRQAFKNNPQLSTVELAQIWINQAKQKMLILSKGRGRVGTTGSANAIKAAPSRLPYVPCS